MKPCALTYTSNIFLILMHCILCAYIDKHVVSNFVRLDLFFYANLSKSILCFLKFEGFKTRFSKFDSLYIIMLLCIWISLPCTFLHFCSFVLNINEYVAFRLDHVGLILCTCLGQVESNNFIHSSIYSVS